MTGIYMFSEKTGKRKPTEVEYATPEERRDLFSKKDFEETMNWIDALCENIVAMDKFLESEGYERKERTDEEA
jgi:hypothetical protein